MNIKEFLFINDGIKLALYLGNNNKKHNKERRFEMKLYVKEKVTGLKIKSAKDVFETIKELGKTDQESVWVVGYDSGNKEIFRGCIFLGGLNSAIVDLKILFKRVLVAGCASFILIHNHPSGELNPSFEDKTLTEKIKQAAQLLQVNFLDHIIIGDDEFFSFMEDGSL